MKRTRLASVSLAAVAAGTVALVVAVSSGNATARPAVAVASAINVKHTTLGPTLVDAKGRTLYLFEADRPSHSNLSSAGFAIWPAFASTGKPRAEGGASAVHIATIAGPNGRRQFTYFGHPLYYYVGDQKPGDTTGQGLNQFGALWYVLSPGGNAVTSAPSTPAPAATSGGYGY
jgi:predicted lipoprotein with Yx(FWY)xxD motif